ncbi:hypothetical protein Nmel_010103 [Mimus melanotis]
MQEIPFFTLDKGHADIPCLCGGVGCWLLILLSIFPEKWLIPGAAQCFTSHPTADLNPLPPLLPDWECKPGFRHQTPHFNPNPRLLHDSCPFPNLLFQKSLKQRLGKSNIQARLGRPAGTLARGALGGRGLALGQRGMPRGALRGRGARAMLRGGVALRGQALLRGGRGIAPRMGLRRGGIRGRGGPGRGGLGRGAMARGGIGGRGQ